jgi:threonine dehydratase
MTTDDIRQAAARLEGRITRTPLVHSLRLSEMTGARVSLKLENQQIEGSFKPRGAFNALLQASSDRAVTASAGNHGRSLAFAAKALGVRLTVFAPRTAPAAKLDYIRRHSADLELCDSYDDAEERALARSKAQGVPFISPYNHRHVIAGAGTVALEILDDLSAPPDMIVVPVGGGGLISGVAIAARGASRPVSVVGVEAEASPAFTRALAAGRLVRVDVQPTLADGLAGNAEEGSITFGFIRDLADRVVAVPEGAIASAMTALMTYEGQRAEGAGATALAGLLSGQLDVTGQHVVVIVSGGNVDHALHSKVVEDAEPADGKS